MTENSEQVEQKVDPFKPSAALLSKLGSAVRHADEAMSEQGHAADEAVFRSLLSDPDVTAWLAAMDEMALLPVKRDV